MRIVILVTLRKLHRVSLLANLSIHYLAPPFHEGINIVVFVICSEVVQK